MDHIHRQLQLMCILLLATTYTATAFLLSRQCIVPSPCFCSGSSFVYCTSNSLTEIPYFGSVTTDEDIPKLNIYLYNNKIHSIPANVFQNVRSVNTASIDFDFENNMISSIDPLAFTGIESKITNLDLKINQLSSLPSVLGKLSKLESLYLEGNPIVSLDSSIMTDLSPNLIALGFDMGHFISSSWPNDLNKLNHLHILIVQYFSLSHIPMNAFVGFESGLTSLKLSYSKLFRIPSAVCHLQNLETLFFDSNAALESSSSLFETCSHNFSKLTTLSLKNDNLYSFPGVLNYFPSLTTLNLNDSKISVIHTDVIPYNNSLETLNLNSNALTHIPSELNKLTQLRYLDLGNNNISTVENQDLIGLTNMNQLQINNNPIESIAPNAFSHNELISHLDLDDTNMHLIPEAVRFLPRLTTFLFKNNNADCSCEMSYLKGWNVTAVTHLIGRCANHQNFNYDGIKVFLMTELPFCP